MDKNYIQAAPTKYYISIIFALFSIIMQIMYESPNHVQNFYE